jgi:hypothetical protein
MAYHAIQQGNTLRLALNRSKAVAPQLTKTGGATRGKVTSFSRKSRKRLFELFNRLNYKHVNTYFITLTYQFDHQYDKQHYKLFLRKLERYYGIAFYSAIWRIERQKRGTPHFHIVLFTHRKLQYVNPNVVARLWTETVGEKATNGKYLFTRVERVWRLRHLMYYVSKYMAKLDDKPKVDNGGAVGIDENGQQYSRVGETAEAIGLINAPYRDAQSTSLGRIWGYFRKPLLPFAPIFVFEIDQNTLVEVKRLLRKIIKPKNGWLKRTLIDYHRSCCVFVGANAAIRAVLEL